jgi:hypothetical protein
MPVNFAEQGVTAAGFGGRAVARRPESFIRSALVKYQFEGEHFGARGVRYTLSDAVTCQPPVGQSFP